jgi:four helix bundle protein
MDDRRWTMDDCRLTFKRQVRKKRVLIVLLLESPTSNSRVFIMANGDDIQERLVKLAVAGMHLCDEVPKSLITSPIAGQLARSASAASANYAEARGAESRSDFVHKLGITYKEMNESENWLRLLTESMTLPEQRIHSVLEECKSLCRIVAASRQTARQRGMNRSGT